MTSFSTSPLFVLRKTKNKILSASILLMLLVPVYSAAQEYQPLLNEDAHWNYEHQITCLPFVIAFYNYSVFLEGDTTINDTTYKKVYRPHREWTTANEGCLEPMLQDTGYVGGLREDEAERMVYFFPPGEDEESEILLYDFSMELGDTLNPYLSVNWDSNVPIVDSVDFVEINGNMHKRMFIRSDWNHYIIEGIGSNFGLVEPFPNATVDAPVTELICWTNGDGHYPDSVEACNLITDVQEIATRKTEISVFPNPAVETIRIQSSEELSGKEIEVQIVNDKGQVVHQEKGTYRSTKTISIAHLSAGTYLVRMKVGPEIATSTFLKL